MENLEIISLPSDQWQEYKNLRLKALKQNPESFGQTYDKARFRNDEEWKLLLNTSLDGQDRWLFFAKLNGQFVGMISGTAMESVKGGVKVQEMFVSPEARGKGIATKLMQKLTSVLKETTDKKVLRLGVFRPQTEAVKLYQSLGFEIIEEKIEQVPSGTHESLIMEKKL